MIQDQKMTELRERALKELSPVNRSWIEERLTEYQELLAYLRDH